MGIGERGNRERLKRWGGERGGERLKRLRNRRETWENRGGGRGKCEDR